MIYEDFFSSILLMIVLLMNLDTTIFIICLMLEVCWRYNYKYSNDRICDYQNFVDDGVVDELRYNMFGGERVTANILTIEFVTVKILLMVVLLKNFDTTILLYD